MPDGPTSDPIRGLIESLIRRERLANTVAVDTAEGLDDLFQRIADLLMRHDPTAVTRERFRRARVDRALSEIQRAIREYTPEMTARLQSQLAEIGRAEAVRAQMALTATLGEVGERVVRSTPITQQRLRAILNTDPFRGKLLKEHTARLSASIYDGVLTEIRLGMVREESIADIVRRVRGRQAGFIRKDALGRFVARGQRAASVRPRFTGGVLGTTTRKAEALVRTAVTHVSNVGALGTYEANADILQSVQYVATLDDRTTEVCLSLDGATWPVGSDDIQTPPLHYSCRSMLVPVVDWAALGLDAPPEPDRIARDLSGVSDEDLRRPVSARRRKARERFGDVERIPSGVRATDWLRDQRIPVQNKVLGVEKARRFREGTITLKDIVRDDNTIVPLSELASTN